MARASRARPNGRRSAAATARTVGVISDTHGLVRPETLAGLGGCDLIVHAGDVGAPGVLARLREIAPVVAVRGNNDRGAWARILPERAIVEVGGRRLQVLHDVKTLGLDPVAAGLDVVIAGHSHRPRIERRHGVLFLNPGSAGLRRFTLPVALARLRVDGRRLVARIVELRVPAAATSRRGSRRGFIRPLRGSLNTKRALERWRETDAVKRRSYSSDVQ